MIEARLITHSISPARIELLTYVLTYPRFIHSEVMTHRAFSRNAASSRAIPISRMIRDIIRNPALPVSWGQNQKGMQAGQELSGWRRWCAINLRRGLRFGSCAEAWLQSKLGTHKQVANRVLEPWAHMSTIVTATEWGNFFNLRAHKDAQPEFQELAYRMLQAYLDSSPQELKEGEWHLPFSDCYAEEGLTTEQLVKITTARCARISYRTFEGLIDHDKDYSLHDQLLVSGHMSPFEHAARVNSIEAARSMSGNFRGYTQYRKLLANENRTAFDARSLLAKRGAA